MKKIVIDTDILIDYLRGLSASEKFLKKALNNSECCISCITVAELYAGVKEQEKLALEQFLELFTVIGVNNEIAKLGGLYRQEYKKSHNIGLADAIIAATSVKFNAKLFTLNKKHYPMLKIDLPYSK